MDPLHNLYVFVEWPNPTALMVASLAVRIFFNHGIFLFFHLFVDLVFGLESTFLVGIAIDGIFLTCYVIM